MKNNSLSKALRVPSGLARILLLSATAAAIAATREPDASGAAFRERAGKLAAVYFARTGVSNATPLATEAMGTFFAAKEIYDAGRYAECRDLLDAFWKKYPAGDVKTWGDTDWPTGYVPLNELTECARARTAPDWFKGKPEPWRLTAVVIGKSANTNLTEDLVELQDPTFTEREVNRAAAFFGEYVKALTKGRLQMETRVVYLNNWIVPPFEPEYFIRAVEASLPREIRDTTDCWWTMVCSSNPAIGFWGGMWVDDDGRPHFLDGSEWVRGNQYRKGPPSEQEYQVGFTGWLHHEFYHYLIHAFPEFQLETVEHQWWYREKWPKDFEGYYETDYFTEALHKRIQTQTDRPIHVRLKYRPPAAVPAAPKAGNGARR